jgi:hypothetical protein
MIPGAGVAWCKRIIVKKNWSKEKVEREARRVQTLRKRRRTRQEGRLETKDLGDTRPLYLRRKRTTMNGIGMWSSGQRSHPGSGGTLQKALYEIFSLRIVTQKARAYVASRKTKVDNVERSALSKW